MSVLAEPRLTLADAARMMRDALKDRSYQERPLGLVVARYIRWKRNEWGATAETIRDYEATLAKLALDHADLELADFQPPVGTERVREFWDARWSDASPRTRAKVLSILRDFFRWACREGLLYGDPTIPITRPKQRQTARGTFTPAVVQQIISAQTRNRDRTALMLLFHLGLRKGELARIQFKHYDGRLLTIHGKGGKVRMLPVVHRKLRDTLEREILDRGAHPDDYLLFPERLGPRYLGGPLEVIWFDTRKPMSSTTLHRWWHGCLERAHVAPRPMHEARHTAITELLRSGANLKHAQQLAGHASIQTTADVYAHFDVGDLAAALRAQDEKED